MPNDWCQRVSPAAFAASGAARPGRLPASGRAEGMWPRHRPVYPKSGPPAGTVNRNSAPPPGARCTVIVPPCASTRPFTMYRPRPAPPRRLARQNCRKMRGTSSGATPSPSSRTATATEPTSANPGVAAGPSGRPAARAPTVSTGCTTTVTVPAPCRTAFSTRFPRIWSTLSASSHVSGRSAGASIRKRSGESPAATRPATILSARSGMSTSWRWTSIRPASIRDTSKSSVISLVTRSASALTVSSMTRFWSSVNRVHQLAVALDPARLDPGHVQKLSDQPGHPVGVGVDGFQHDPFLVIGEPCPLGQERRGKAFDAGKWRAKFVGDGGDQIGTAALDPRALLRSTESNYNALHGAWVAQPPGTEVAAPRPAHIAHGDQELGTVRQVERCLRVPGPGGQPPVGVDEGPPAAPVRVVQRQYLPDVSAQRVEGGDAGEPLGRPVEHRDPGRGVGNDHAVRQLVSADQATRGHDSPGRHTGQGRRGRPAWTQPIHLTAASIRHQRLCSA